MCIWTNTGDIYSTECNQSFPVDGHRGKYCRSCSTLITERRQGMTPGPWGVDEDGDVIASDDASGDFTLIALFRDCDNPMANARAIAKLPEIVEAGRQLVQICNSALNCHDMATANSADRLCKLLDEAEGVQ